MPRHRFLVRQLSQVGDGHWPGFGAGKQFP